LPGSALRPLACETRLLAQLALDLGQTLLDVRGGGRRGGRLARRRRALTQVLDLRVRVLDLLEASRRLRRAVVVVGVVELDQPPVGGA